MILMATIYLLSCDFAQLSSISFVYSIINLNWLVFHSIMELTAKIDPNTKLSTLSDDIEKEGVLDATGALQQRANEIRNEVVNWMSYQQSNMITNDDYNFIIAFDKARDKKSRDAILETQAYQCSKTFLSLLGHISKDQTLQYILIMIDDMLQEDKSRVELFKPTKHSKKKSDSQWTPFLSLLNRPDGFITNMTSRIIAKLACWSKEPMDGSDLNFYLTWLKEQLRQPNNEYIQSVVRCMQMMLRTDEYRLAFVAVDGISKLVTVLAGKGNYQIQYQLIFCIWVMTFNVTLAEKMNKFNVIPILSDILSECPKEKVTRIILATLKNLIEKPEETSISRDNAIAMVQCKVLKQLDILQSRRFDDPDINEDLEFLTETLQTSVQDLSSFDEYSTEVKSGRLEWSPVHNSEKFWRENTTRLNDKNYELLKILIYILQNSKDPLVLSVAAHDIGEYVRHYPRGKHIIEGLGGKQQVMHLLSHDDPNVRYQALLCVQKLMVHNWTSLCLKCSGLNLKHNSSTESKCSLGNCFFKTDFSSK